MAAYRLETDTEDTVVNFGPPFAHMSTYTYVGVDAYGHVRHTYKYLDTNGHVFCCPTVLTKIAPVPIPLLCVGVHFLPI